MEVEDGGVTAVTASDVTGNGHNPEAWRRVTAKPGDTRNYPRFSEKKAF